MTNTRYGYLEQHCICQDMYVQVHKNTQALSSVNQSWTKAAQIPNIANYTQPCKADIGYLRYLPVSVRNATSNVSDWLFLAVSAIPECDRSDPGKVGARALSDNKLLIQSSFGDTREGLPQQMTFVLPTNDASCHHFLSSLTCPT